MKHQDAVRPSQMQAGQQLGHASGDNRKERTLCPGQQQVTCQQPVLQGRLQGKFSTPLCDMQAMQGRPILHQLLVHFLCSWPFLVFLANRPRVRRTFRYPPG